MQLAELIKIKEMVKEMIPYVRDAIPESCGACGTPNAQCDMNCVDAAHGNELLLRALKFTRDIP